MHDFVTQSSCHSNCALAFKEVTALLGRATVVIQKPAVLYGNSAETHTASCSLCFSNRTLYCAFSNFPGFVAEFYSATLR